MIDERPPGSPDEFVFVEMRGFPVLTEVEEKRRAEQLLELLEQIAKLYILFDIVFGIIVNKVILFLEHFDEFVSG